MSFNFLKTIKNIVVKNPVLTGVALCAGALIYFMPHAVHAADWTDIFSDPSILVAELFNFIAEQLLALTAWILGAAGLILKEVMVLSLLKLSWIVDNEGVRAAWSTFRDLANMLFIFVLLYAAINTILGLGDRDIKRLISRIVIVALLLNFSFFFTKVALDASNIFSVGFYNQIIKTPCGQGANAKPVGDIGTAFACKLKFASIYDSKTSQAITTSAGGNTLAEAGKFLLLGILGSIFFMVTAFVFLAAGFMFIVRLATILFLFILAPLAFVSNVIPGYDDNWNKWIKTLTKVCIFPPIFLAMIWAVLRMADAVAIDVGTGTIASAITGGADGKLSPDTGAILLNFAILIAMIVGSLVVASELGVKGADGALKMLNSGRGWAQGKLGRGVVRGTGLRWAAESAANSEWGNTRLGRSLRSISTDAILNQKFGSKSSTADVDKKLKKGDEKYAEIIEKKVTKDAEKKLEAKYGEMNNVGLHTSRVAETQKKIDEKKAEIERHEDLADMAKGVGNIEREKVHRKNAEKAMEEQIALEKEKEKHEAAVEIAKERKGKGPTDEERKEFIAAAKSAEAIKIENDKGFLKRRVIGGKLEDTATGLGRGAAVGAALGSLAAPGLGTAAGILAGGAVGAVTGFWGITKPNFTPQNPRKLAVDILRGKKKLHKEPTLEDLEKVLGIHVAHEDHGDDHGGGHGGGGKKDDHGGHGGGGKKDDHSGGGHGGGGHGGGGHGGGGGHH